MLDTLNRSWALLLGMLLLMIGNGLQGTLLGVRGSLEGFSTFQMSLVMSAYFVGFLGGSRLAPELIARVGHVRVFAALASLISAILVMYPVFVHPVAWIALRVAIGFCFSGVYVTAESWLNNAASNENRGKALSLYMIVQMAGVVTAQGVLTLADPAGFILFIVPSVLVSIAFAPILLSITPTPAFETAKPMGFLEIFRKLPLCCFGMLVMGGVYSGLFGMSSVYASQAGFTVPQISLFVSAIYLGGLLFQFPIGALSDRMDRRWLIVLVSGFGAAAAFLGTVTSEFTVIVVVGFLVGGMANPIYALLIAYANDHLEREDMAAASGRLLFLNGVGSIIGPLVIGGLMGLVGIYGFFMLIFACLVAQSGYALYRMTQRPSPSSEESGAWVPISSQATGVTLSAAQEWSAELAQDAADQPEHAAEEEKAEFDAAARHSAAG